MAHAPAPRNTPSITVVSTIVVMIVIGGFAALVVLVQLLNNAGKQPTPARLDHTRRQTMMNAYSAALEIVREQDQYIEDLEAENKMLKERLNQQSPAFQQ